MRATLVCGCLFGFVTGCGSGNQESRKAPPPEAPQVVESGSSSTVAPSVDSRAEGTSVALVEVASYDLRMNQRDFKAMQANPFSDQAFEATFVAGDETFEGVRVRHRGAWARSWPKKPLKVAFKDDQTLDGYDRLNFNSCWRDASFIREWLAYYIYTASGAPSPQARMVRLNLNGQFLGLYVQVEQPDKEFLKRVGCKGAVIYKADSSTNQSDERDFGNAAAFASHYEKETRKASGHASLHQFCRELAQASDAEEFFKRRVDIEKYINYLAATVLVQNWDGYNKNHYLVEDLKGTGKWFVVPWDLDRTLGDHWSQGFDETRLPVLLGTRAEPGVTGWNRMADRFLSHPSLRARFLDRLRQLIDSEFTPNKLFPLLDRMESQLTAAAAADRRRWPGPAGDIHTGMSEVKNYITRRRDFLTQQLQRLR